MAILEELMVRIGVDTSQLDQGTADAANQAESNLQGIGGMAAGAAVGGLFAVGLQSAMDISGAKTKLENQLNLTGEQAQQAGDIAGEVFTAGFGESMDDVTNSIASVSSSIGEFGDFTEAEMEQMSKSALGLAKTFDIDVGEATQAVGQMIKTGLVSDANEGFDMITAGMQEIPAAMRGDLLSAFNEYGTQFRDLGLNGADAMGLMIQGVKGGAKDIDMVADTLKEFSIEAVQGGAKVGDAWKEMGLDSDQMFKMMGKGGDSAKQALSTTIQTLKGVKDPTKQAELAVALFGTKAEDMGDALFGLDPASSAASTGMKDASGAAGELTKKMEDDPAQKMDAAMRSVSDTLGTSLAPLLEKVAGFLADNEGLIKFLVPVVLSLAVAMGIWAAAQWAVNLAMMASPATWIILGIIALIVIIVLLVSKWDWVKEKIGQVWDWIIDKLSGAWEWIKTKIGEFWTWIKDKFQKGVDWLVDLFLNWTIVGRVIKHWNTIKTKTAEIWNKVLDWIKGIPGKIVDFFLNWTLPGLIIKHWEKIKSGVIEKAKQLLDWVRGLPGRIKSGLGNLKNLLWNAGRDLIAGLVDGMKAMGQYLIDVAKNIVGNAINAAKNVLGISSPSKVFRDIGMDTAAGLALGIEGGTGHVIDATNDMANDVTRAGKEVVKAAEEIAKQAADALERAKSRPKSGFGAALAEVKKLVDSGKWNKEGSLLFEDISFQGMSKNYEKYHSQIADGFWDAVREIKRAVQSGKQVFEDMTFQGMSKNVEQYHDMIAQIWRGNPWGTTFGDYGKWAPQGADLPRLGDGGIATGATLAVVGEAGEPEAIIPLSRLETMINTAQQPTMTKIQPAHQQNGGWTLDVTGGDEDLINLVRKWVRERGNDPQTALRY